MPIKRAAESSIYVGDGNLRLLLFDQFTCFLIKSYHLKLCHRGNESKDIMKLYFSFLSIC